MQPIKINLTHLTFIPVKLDGPEIALYYFAVENVLNTIRNARDYSTEAAKLHLIHECLKKNATGFNHALLKAADKIVKELQKGAPIHLIAKFQKFTFTVNSKGDFAKIIEAYNQSLKKN